MRIIKVGAAVGDFAGDKDEARALRQGQLAAATRAGEEVELGCESVELATQSFVHALISDLVRSKEFDALALTTFTNCNDSVRELVEIVVEYSQEDVVAHDPDGADG